VGVSGGVGVSVVVDTAFGSVGVDTAFGSVGVSVVVDTGLGSVGPVAGLETFGPWGAGPFGRFN